MIDKFDKFFSELNESYEKKATIKWVDNNHLIGLFIVSNIVYKIQCIPYDNNIWSYKFMRYNNQTNTFDLNLIKTDWKDKMTILSTIRSGMDYLINNKNPNGLIFAALDSSDGRKKLYETYSNEIVNNYYYKLEKNLFEDKLIFILYKNIAINLVIDVIEDMISEI
jgi:hypothetical protein